MARYLQAATTVASRADASRIARALVERRLAACVQVVGPIQSTYRWKGRIETAREWLCLMKTTRGRYAELEAALLNLHPYELPEVVSVAFAGGSRGYLEWLSEALGGAKPRRKTAGGRKGAC